MKYALLILYLVTLVVIGFLLYLSLYKPSRVHKRSEIPHASFETHWWGYGWRPWWRKYSGLPGFTPEEGKPLPEPKMPIVPQSYIIPNRPRVIQ